MIQVKMSPTEAQTFQRYSKNSIATILMNRKCNCDPYYDWFTFKRWIAQGKCVKKGEHGIKLLIYTPSEIIDDDGEEVVINKRFYSAWVFCRCQVHDIKNDGTSHPAAKPNEECTVNTHNSIKQEVALSVETFLDNLFAANTSSNRGV